MCSKSYQVETCFLTISTIVWNSEHNTMGGHQAPRELKLYVPLNPTSHESFEDYIVPRNSREFTLVFLPTLQSLSHLFLLLCIWLLCILHYKSKHVSKIINWLWSTMYDINVISFFHQQTQKLALSIINLHFQAGATGIGIQLYWSPLWYNGT